MCNMLLTFAFQDLIACLSYCRPVFCHIYGQLCVVNSAALVAGFASELWVSLLLLISVYHYAFVGCIFSG